MRPSKRTHLENYVLELRRGAVVLAVLSALSEERYGYSLRQQLAESGLKISEGTLYPLMRRLESQGFLESVWRVSSNRPRRYYKSSKKGLSALTALAEEWRSLVEATEALLPPI